MWLAKNTLINPTPLQLSQHASHKLRIFETNDRLKMIASKRFQFVIKFKLNQLVMPFRKINGRSTILRCRCN